MENRKFTGTYGVVALFNEETDHFVQKMAQMCTSDREPNYRVHRAHVTLYHGPFNNLPEDFIAELLRSFPRRMPLVQLRTISTYGGKFLFWDFKTIHRSWKLLHFASLSLSGFLDQDALAAAEKEALSIHHPNEHSNLTRFRHPLVGPEQRPHITLAYDEKGITLSRDLAQPKRLQVQKFAFVEIGPYGSVANVIDI